MHILYLAQHFTPSDGIGGSRPASMSSRLVKAGHRVTFITSSASFPESYRFTEAVSSIRVDGVDLRVIDVAYSNQLTYVQRIKSFLVFAYKAGVEAARVDAVDLIFATSTPLTIALPAVWAKHRHRKPMVFEVRDLWPELPIALGALKNPVVKWVAVWLEKWAYRNSDHVIALSPGMKTGVVRAGCPPEKVTVVPNNCDVGAFRVDRSAGESFLNEHPYLKGSALVTYSGTLGVINGVGYLVDIAAKMLTLDPSVRFLIVGSGKEKDVVVERARAAGVLERNLWILPALYKKDMPRLLSASTLPVSLFINLPQMWHNSANKFFDALAAARPVMINYQGWQADIIRASRAGLVVPPDDAAAAADQLQRFLSDGAAVKAAGEAAARLADTEFNRDRLFEVFRKTLEEAAA